MKDEQSSSGWHFKKEVSVGHLVSFAGALAAVIGAYNHLDKRVALLEQLVAEQKVVDKRQDEEHIRAQARIDATLTEISRKLDRIIEGRR